MSTSLFFFCPRCAGLKEEARWYLSKFSWGHSFITLNESLLDKYAACKDGAAVLEAQNEYIKQAEDERTARRAKNDYLDFSSSSSSSNEGDDDDEEEEADDEETAGGGAASGSKATGAKATTAAAVTKTAVDTEGENSVSK